MKATRRLHDVGQSIWLDNITRGLLTGGGLERYIRELSVTGLTSNPTIFDNAIKAGSDYDAAIREKTAAGKQGEELFFELALEDLTRAADLLRPVHEATDRVDGWVSLEVSPKLAYDTAGTIAAAMELHGRAGAPQPLHQDPGHDGRHSGDRGGDLRRRAGQCHAALLARAVPRRGRCLHARHRAPGRRRPQPARGFGGLALRQPLGRRGGGQGSGASREPPRHRHCDPHVQGLPRAARFAIAGCGSSMPGRGRSACCGPAPAPRTPRRSDRPLRGGAGGSAHGEHDAREDAAWRSPITARSAARWPRDGGDAEPVLAELRARRGRHRRLAAHLQRAGAAAFVKSWDDLLARVVEKSAALKKAV